MGSGIVNRRLPPFENLIGMVLNTVALRADLRDDPTVKELLRRVRRTAVEAYGNQDLPFEEVLQAVHPQRRAGAAPLYQVMFSFQDPPWADLDLPGVALQVDDTVGNGSSKADVNVIVLNRRTESDSLTLMWEYATDLFDESEAQSMVASYLCLLDAISHDTATRISRPPMAASPMRERVLALAGRDNAYEREASISELSSPCRRGSRRSCTALGRTAHLRRAESKGEPARPPAGGARGRRCRVVVAVPRSADAVVVVLAVLKAGSAYVALDTNLPPARIEGLLEDAQPAVICTTSDRLQKLPRQPSRRWSWTKRAWKARVTRMWVVWSSRRPRPTSRTRRVRAVCPRVPSSRIGR